MGFIEDASFSFDTKIFINEPLRKHCTLGVGGNALYYAEVKSLHALRILIDAANDNKIKYKVIGNGSNLLISDSGYNGLIISLKNLCDVYFSDGTLRVCSGVNLSNLLRFCEKNNLGGIEGLSGIPATVGGAVVMNASANECSISENVLSVETLSDGKINKYLKSECGFSYRKSRFFGKKEIITAVNFNLRKGFSTELYEKCSLYRRTTQPQGKTCGCIFKNPQGDSAGRIIESCKLKGLMVGGAAVSNVHANFITTSVNATADDVFRLISIIKTQVENTTGIQLKEEVECIGFK